MVAPRIWRWYTAHLTARPLRTRMITSGLLFTVGDFISQHGIEGPRTLWPESWYERQDREDELRRNGIPRLITDGEWVGEQEDLSSSAAAAATASDGAVQWQSQTTQGHDYVRTARLAFYGTFIFAPLVNTWLGFLERFVVIPNRPRLTIGAKVLADIGLWGPFIVSVFWSANGVLEGKSSEQVYQKWSNAFIPSISKSILVFGPTQILNFSLVPVQHRMLITQCVGLGWNTFLSYSNNIANTKQLANLEENNTNAATTATMGERTTQRLLLALEKGEGAIEHKVEKVFPGIHITQDQQDARTNKQQKGPYGNLAVDQVGI